MLSTPFYLGCVEQTLQGLPHGEEGARGGEEEEEEGRRGERGDGPFTTGPWYAEYTGRTTERPDRPAAGQGEHLRAGGGGVEQAGRRSSQLRDPGPSPLSTRQPTGSREPAWSPAEPVPAAGGAPQRPTAAVHSDIRPTKQ